MSVIIGVIIFILIIFAILEDESPAIFYILVSLIFFDCWSMTLRILWAIIKSF